MIGDENSKGIIVYEDFDFSAELYLTFYQIIHYGKKDISVVVSILKTLKNIGNISKEKNLKTLKEFSEYVYEISIENFTHKFDQDLIEKYRYNEDEK